jgi:hypothetical protein
MHAARKLEPHDTQTHRWPRPHSRPTPYRSGTPVAPYATGHLFTLPALSVEGSFGRRLFVPSFPANRDVLIDSAEKLEIAATHRKQTTKVFLIDSKTAPFRTTLAQTHRRNSRPTPCVLHTKTTG